MNKSQPLLLISCHSSIWNYSITAGIIHVNVALINLWVGGRLSAVRKTSYGKCKNVSLFGLFHLNSYWLICLMVIVRTSLLLRGESCIRNVHMFVVFFEVSLKNTEGAKVQILFPLMLRQPLIFISYHQPSSEEQVSVLSQT